jgi:LmbE family N-acetylglucosaminyl deacetylase
MAVFAHPGDVELKMGGTAAKFTELGHAVKFLSLTKGDAGHYEYGGQALAKIRKWKADVVIGLKPNDYHPDHRYAGDLVIDAAYLVIVPNVVPDTPPLKKNAVFLYMQYSFQKPYQFRPDITVNIEETFDKKIGGMDAHKSQFYGWFAWSSSVIDTVPETDQKRKQWLENWLNDWLDNSEKLPPEYKPSLEKWYRGDNAIKNLTFPKVEAFEIVEY